MIVFKGIIRGSFSEMQAAGFNEPAIMKFEGKNLFDLLSEFVLPEWIFTLQVNGRKIKHVRKYLKSKGLDWSLFCRKEHNFDFTEEVTP